MEGISIINVVKEGGKSGIINKRKTERIGIKNLKV
jgi:hypothetical protein